MPYFVYASCEGSCGTAHFHKLVGQSLEAYDIITKISCAENDCLFIHKVKICHLNTLNGAALLYLLT